MEGIDETLMAMAMHRLTRPEKRAFVPAGASDPAAMGGGAPPGADPAAAGAAPQDPAAMAAAGGMPPGGAPPAAAAPPAPAPLPGASPGGAPAAPAAPVQQKIKPEQMMQMLDTRLYNLQQQVTAIMNHHGITLPPGVLVLPPGMTSAPVAETAVPGGPMDPGPAQQPAAAGGDTGAISPIEPMQGAAPAAKAAAAIFGEELARRIIDEQNALEEKQSDSYIGDPVSRISPHAAAADAADENTAKAATVMRLLNSRQRANALASATA